MNALLWFCKLDDKVLPHQLDNSEGLTSWRMACERINDDDPTAFLDASDLLGEPVSLGDAVNANRPQETKVERKRRRNGHAARLAREARMAASVAALLAATVKKSARAVAKRQQEEAAVCSVRDQRERWKKYHPPQLTREEHESWHAAYCRENEAALARLIKAGIIR